MTWEFDMRIHPRSLQMGEPIMIHVDSGPLNGMHGTGEVTLELFELDSYRKANGQMTDGEDPLRDVGNDDDRIATWKGIISHGIRHGVGGWHFQPVGDVLLADNTTRPSYEPDEPPGHVLGQALTVRFEGMRKVYYVAMPFMSERNQESRGGEGAELELGLVLKEGDTVLYNSRSAVSFVRDWRWWAASSFAPARAGNQVTLYQDGEEYFPAIRDAINQAKDYIFITDWKMVPYVCLDRSTPIPEPAYPLTKWGPGKAAVPSPEWDKNTVIELLIEAIARDKVDVRVLLWKSPGFEDTLDDMTFAYLMANGIKCAFHNPQGDKNALTDIYWSHHQKSVVIDDEVAFIGGLDLASKRWDTAEHDPFDRRADPSSGRLTDNRAFLKQQRTDDRFFPNRKELISRAGRYQHKGLREKDFAKQVEGYYLDRDKNPATWQVFKHTYGKDRNGAQHAPMLRDRNPRSGWHDTHCRVKGPSAIDIKRNFVQRWLVCIEPTAADLEGASRDLNETFLDKTMQPPAWAQGGGLEAAPFEIASKFGKSSAASRIKKAIKQAEDCRHFPSVTWWNERLKNPENWEKTVEEMQNNSDHWLINFPPGVMSLVPVEPNAKKPKPEPACEKKAPKEEESPPCVVQLLRSISNDSLHPISIHVNKEHSLQEYDKLLEERGQGPERSIYAAYHHAINAASHFIYIETQMFISAGFPGAHGEVENAVAGFLYQKIKHKIARQQPFHVYLVLPEIYNSDPVGTVSKEIQHWQWQTLTALEKAIEALASPMGNKASDYLSIFALRAVGISTNNLEQIRSNQIYVHSKLMIVDDRFVTLGSANLNDRSLVGYRDTELNVGILGPADKRVTLSGRPWNVNAQASKFRIDLFKEHLGSHYNDALVDASHPTSVAHIQHAAQQNWRVFKGLYHLEMQYLDHEERARGITDPEQVQGIPKTTRKLRSQLRRIHSMVLGKGHLITHPFRERRESKGSASALLPDLITT